eukprot:14003741-Alexandrium_andersonii.AAC.1
MAYALDALTPYPRHFHGLRGMDLAIKLHVGTDGKLRWEHFHELTTLARPAVPAAEWFDRSAVATLHRAIGFACDIVP